MNTIGATDISPRESEVLRLLEERLSNAQIANRLHISVRTVENHVSSLLRKLGVADRRALAAFTGNGRPGSVLVPAAMTGMPVPRTTFHGRAHEHDGILAALSGHRLVTLLGPGGVGKTRLAKAVAVSAVAEFPLGGAFIDLVPVRAGFVPQAVAAALGVIETPQRSFEDAIVDRLGDGRFLLVLDNCEHLAEAAAFIVERVLSDCPGVTILTTSRQRLGISGEQVTRIAPLPLASTAEALFFDRATSADPGFTADASVVSRICSQLDGMPLAIELAAVRAVSLGADALLVALGNALRLLAGSRASDERHRSLRAVINWSHDLLDAEEQTLFGNLSVFVGGFGLQDAVTVAGCGDAATVADVLGRLVDKSLVEFEPAGRWRLLETIRSYALEKLADSGALTAVTGRHLNWAAERATELAGRLDGQWRQEFDLIVDDLRVALAGLEPHPARTPHRLAVALGRLSYARRFLWESIDHFRAAARYAPTPAEAAASLTTASEAVYAIGHAGQAFELLMAAAREAGGAEDGNTRSVILARAVTTAARFPSGFTTGGGDVNLLEMLREAAAAGDGNDPKVAAHMASATAWVSMSGQSKPDPDLAEAAVSAARLTMDPILICGSLDVPGSIAIAQGRSREAHRIARTRMSLLAGMDRLSPYPAAEFLDTFHTAWLCAIAAGDLPSALETALLIRQDDLLGVHPYRATSKLVPTLVMMGRFDEAVEVAQTMWDGWRRAGGPPAVWMSPAISAVALAHGLRGDGDGYARWCRRATDSPGFAGSALVRHNASFAAFVAARVSVHTGVTAEASTMVEQAFGEFAVRRYEPYARAAGAEAAVVAGLPDAADRVAQAQSGALENDWAAACLARAAGRLHDDGEALRASLDGWERIGARFERACTLLLMPDRAHEGRTELAAMSVPPPAL